MQKSLGEINTSIKSMDKTIEGMKSRVDDLVAWKHKILGGAVVLGAVIALLSALIGWGLKYITIKSPAEQVQQITHPIAQPVIEDQPNKPSPSRRND